MFLRQLYHGGGGQARPAAPVWWRVLLGGVTVSFLTGFLGVGGGFLIVPALVLLLGMDMRDAVGSSLVVIAINSAAGLLGHLGDGALNWALIGTLLAGGAPSLLLVARAPAAELRHVCGAAGHNPAGDQSPTADHISQAFRAALDQNYLLKGASGVRYERPRASGKTVLPCAPSPASRFGTVWYTRGMMLLI